MKRWTLGGAAIALIAVAGPARCEPDSSPPASMTAAPCELHVWPAPEIKAVTQDWIFNHTVNQAFDPNKGKIDKPQGLISDQRALLAQLDLATMVSVAGSVTVVHEQPLSRAEVTAVKARHAQSASPCYTELVVSQIFYDAAPLAQKSLRSLIVLRRFGDAAEPKSVFSTWADSDLKLFPPTRPDQAEAALSELETAYKNNIRLFAGYVANPKKHK